MQRLYIYFTLICAFLNMPEFGGAVLLWQRLNLSDCPVSEFETTYFMLISLPRADYNAAEEMIDYDARILGDMALLCDRKLVRMA